MYYDTYDICYFLIIYNLLSTVYVNIDCFTICILTAKPWCTIIHTVYPKKYVHGFVVLCFVVVMQSFIMHSHEVFIHIHQVCFAGTGAIVRLPQCQWSKPDGYGKISQCITTTKHSKAKNMCIFLGIYCIPQNHWCKDIWRNWSVWYQLCTYKCTSTKKCRPIWINDIDTVECHYNVVQFMILHTTIRWQCQKVNQILISPSWASCGCLLWGFVRKLTVLWWHRTVCCQHDPLEQILNHSESYHSR